jgi:phosphoadenosine phosphosulfate reductase
MVKKQLASGEPCEKCAQAEEMLKRRGHWEQIDEVVWAIEDDPTSPGALLGAQHNVKLAPFFIVRNEDGEERIYTSALRMARDCFPGAAPTAKPTTPSTEDQPAEDLAALASRFDRAVPEDILRWGLERYGERCAIAFRGTEDIALIDMATRSGLPFRVFTVDTGRLNEETYAYFEEVTRRYGVVVQPYLPDATELGDLLNRKGPNSFYRDGHEECCRIRRIGPLQRALRECEAWVTAKRRDEQSAGNLELPVVQADPDFRGVGRQLVQINPLAGWTRARVWEYIREHDVPYNELHDRGYLKIGCQPCTRPTGGAHGERESRWWWEKPELSGEHHESGDGI